MMHTSAISTGEQVLELGQIAAVIETESPWSAELRKSVEIT